MLKNIYESQMSKNDQKYYSTEMMGAEMYHYNHAVEVMILSLLIGRKMGLDRDEFEEMKRHVEYSYSMLKDLVGLSSLSRQIVLLHHEKLDGSGYPNGFSGDQIPLLVRIATPSKLDQDVFMMLLQVIDVYPPGTLVELGDGKVCIVIQSNSNSPTRPILRVIEPGTKSSNGEEIDLMQELTLFIKKVLPKLS